MIKHTFRLFCLSAVLLMGCRKNFVFETDGHEIDFAALGSGKIVATSYGNLKNYYIDIDAQQVYLLPLPENNENNFTVDPQGRFAYTVDARNIYRAVPGEWEWEKLDFSLPAGRDEAAWIYNLEVDPTNSTLYFIWAKLQGGERPLMALDLESGELNDLSQKLGFPVWDFTINPVSGDLLIADYQEVNNRKVLINIDPQTGIGDSLYSYPLTGNEGFNALPVLRWLPNGEELALVDPNEENFIVRLNVKTGESSTMFDQYQLAFYYSPLAFSPDGERYLFEDIQSLSLEDWDSSRETYDYQNKADFLLQFCEYSCYSVAKIYWWP